MADTVNESDHSTRRIVQVGTIQSKGFTPPSSSHCSNFCMMESCKYITTHKTAILAPKKNPCTSAYSSWNQFASAPAIAFRTQRIAKQDDIDVAAIIKRFMTLTGIFVPDSLDILRTRHNTPTPVPMKVNKSALHSAEMKNHTKYTKEFHINLDDGTYC
eukprot:TRINITY_DN4498_c0_g1_i1.p1 TRINITY_DN4498_c0_g1~~TRINITY_DN4498_c0_g1_i1.p1  ORF type:complete len:159 (-),score=13.46 TRINITY_DN4498_c0_g1_i1:42-518(-)